LPTLETVFGYPTFLLFSLVSVFRKSSDFGLVSPLLTAMSFTKLRIMERRLAKFQKWFGVAEIFFWNFASLMLDDGTDRMGGIVVQYET